MDQGATFRVTVPKYATKDPNYRILAHQRSRFTHYYFYLRDETLGPMVMRVASFFPFRTTYYLNGHSFIERSEEHTSELQSRFDLVCRLLLEKKKLGNTRGCSSCVAATGRLTPHRPRQPASNQLN